jgi:hypothetical protein
MKPLFETNEWPKLAVYDIEATDWVNIVCIGHIDEYENKQIFQSMKDYIAWIFSNKFQGSHVWAHWGGHYDHRFVIAYVTSLGWSWQTIQSGNLLIIIKVREPVTGREICFCESARLMPDSVAKIGKTVGLEKLDVDRTKIDELTKEQVEEYCLRDCEIVLKGLQYIKKVFLSVDCDFAYTLASISTRWVRRSDALEWHKFYEQGLHGLEYSKDMLKADEFCLPSYFGGRVEVFKTGFFKLPLYYYDITSSYPWSMTHDLPAYFDGFHPPPKNIVDALDHCAISDATVYIPERTFRIPVLPVRFKNKLIFPTGEFRGRWTNLELKALWLRGRNKGVKIKIHGQARFISKPFLRPFVDTFYGLRKIAKIEKDEFSSYAYKILLNSLYGKLVENIERKSILHGADLVSEAIEEFGTKAVVPTSTPGIYALLTTNLGPFRHVAAGSYVTSYSRLRLLEGMETCMREGGKIYYCDTDSIVTDKDIKTFKDTDPDVLGSFKPEYTFQFAEFVCPKVYRAKTTDGKNIYKVKGMPIKGNSEKENLLRWDLYNENLNENSRKRIERMNLTEKQRKKYSSKEGIAGFMTDLNKGAITPRKQILTRQIKTEDSKRIHKNGNSIPINIKYDKQA